MTYHTINFPTGITVSYTSFIPETHTTGEHHLIFSSENFKGTVPERINALVNSMHHIKDTDLLAKNLTPVFCRWFLSDAANQGCHISPDSLDCASSIIQQPPLDNSKISLWVYCINNVETKCEDNNIFSVKHGNYTHYWHGDRDISQKNPEAATEEYLGRFSAWLEENDCTLADNCLRTWFFVRDVDLNYKGVVVGRNNIFDKTGLTVDNHFIASTGIGGRKVADNQTVSFNAYAVKGLNPQQIRYLKAPSHLNSTMEYGVAFERGTSIDYGDRRHAIISGTASINKYGEIMHRGDIVKQTFRMLENVEKLLEEAEMTWSDTAHAIIYLRDISDYNDVKKIMDEKLPHIPKVIVLAPVCRPGWLIEMECMAIKPQKCIEFASF